jgi:hypothetical protein
VSIAGRFSGLARGEVVGSLDVGRHVAQRGEAARGPRRGATARAGCLAQESRTIHQHDWIGYNVGDMWGIYANDVQARDAGSNAFIAWIGRYDR